MAKEEATFTRSDVQKMIDEAVGAALRMGLPNRQTDHPETPDEWFYRQLEGMGQHVPEADRKRAVPNVMRFACVSPETGARFTAVVAQSKAFPRGRTVELEDYTYPPGVDKSVSEGGRVPDGQPIYERGPNGMDLAIRYKQWRRDEFVLKDWPRYVGQDAGRLREAVEGEADLARLAELAPRR